MERRRFLVNLGASFAAVPFLSKVSQGLHDRLQLLSHDLKNTTRPDAFWRRVREEFQLNPGLIHLNCGTLGATPRLVVDAVANALQEIEGNPAVKIYGWGIDAMEAVQTQIADFIGADPDEIALTRNTTEAMNAVAEGLDFKAGDQVLTTNHEHGGGMVCWQYLRKHLGIEMRYIKMPKKVSGKDQILQLVQDHLTPRTKVCSFSHLETINGIIMPMAEIAAITRPRNIVLVCDGAQAPGMLEVDVKALGVDTYACSGHKWMLAPKGTGFLYIRKEMQDRIRPMFLHSGYSSYTASSGTRDVAIILGQGVAIDFHNTIGRKRVADRCRRLSAYLRDRLNGVPGLNLLSPPSAELSAGILTCALERGKNSDIRGRLSTEHQVIVKAAQSTYAYCEEENLPKENYNALRFSTHIFNDEAEIDRALDVIDEILRNT